MRFRALATDYDGTLAYEGKVEPAALFALARVRASGRKVLLVTGRELSDLKTVFSPLTSFDLVVAENGALLYDPRTEQETLLGDPPAAVFLDEMKRRGVPFSRGRSIVATLEPHDAETVKVIRDLGLELQVIFNKGSVMVLPSGVNKATGLAAALQVLGLPPESVVGVGDAENDHAFLSLCGAGVAVSTALPMLKERADWTTTGPAGEGVAELANELVETDFAGRAEALSRRAERARVALQAKAALNRAPEKPH